VSRVLYSVFLLAFAANWGHNKHIESEIFMKIWELENFKFTSRYLWAAFLISSPWALLTTFELIDPYRDITGIFTLISALISVTFIIASITEKEKQTLFLLVDAIIVMFIAFLPFVCVVPR
jgi:hypothetical protein